MTVLEFFNRLLGRQASGATAKERLRLVLMSDHLSLAPEMVEAMKRDLVDVISRYVEVDRDKIDVHFEHQDRALSMMANIPITGVARNGAASNGTNGHYTNGHTSTSHPEPVEVRPSMAEASASHPAPVEGQPSMAEAPASHPELVDGRPSIAEAPEMLAADEQPKPAAPKPKPITAKNAARPRRKRRKASG